MTLEQASKNFLAALIAAAPGDSLEVQIARKQVEVAVSVLVTQATMTAIENSFASASKEMDAIKASFASAVKATEK